MRHSSTSPCSASSHAISHLPFSHSLLFPTLFRSHLLLCIHCKCLLMRMIEPHFIILTSFFFYSTESSPILPYSPSVLLFLSYPFSFSFSITVLDVQLFPLQSSLYPRFPTHFSTFSSQGFIEKKI